MSTNTTGFPLASSVSEFGLTNRIIAPLTKRLAAYEAAKATPGSGKDAVFLDRLHSVLGTGGGESAGGSEQGRDPTLVMPQ